MSVQSFEQLILEGIRGLPPETLAEVTDFVYFERVLQPQVFEEELRNALLETELRHLSRREAHHLEQEFEGYDQRYPRE